MRNPDTWFAEYGESHQNSTNKTLHWICLPLIVLSLLGMLWSIPVPAFMSELSPYLNWATLIMILALIYYFMLSVPLAIGMTLVMALFLMVLRAVDASGVSVLVTSVVVFVAAWIGQFVGHHIEGKRPSFFKDVQFLMIGPIWLLGFVYRRLGIAY